MHRSRQQAVGVRGAAVLLVVLLQEPHQGALAEVCFGHDLQPRGLEHSQLQRTRKLAAMKQEYSLQYMEVCWPCKVGPSGSTALESE